jgi:hypothetical protein
MATIAVAMASMSRSLLSRAVRSGAAPSRLQAALSVIGTVSARHASAGTAEGRSEPRAAPAHHGWRSARQTRQPAGTKARGDREGPKEDSRFAMRKEELRPPPEFFATDRYAQLPVEVLGKLMAPLYPRAHGLYLRQHELLFEAALARLQPLRADGPIGQLRAAETALRVLSGSIFPRVVTELKRYSGVRRGAARRSPARWLTEAMLQADKAIKATEKAIAAVRAMERPQNESAAVERSGDAPPSNDGGARSTGCVPPCPPPSLPATLVTLIPMDRVFRSEAALLRLEHRLGYAAMIAMQKILRCALFTLASDGAACEEILGLFRRNGIKVRGRARLRR